MSEELSKIPFDEIPKIPLNAEGMIVRLSKEHRERILGKIDRKKYFIPAVSQKDGTRIIFVVALEEAMPSREECLRLKEQGMLFGLPVTESEISELDSGGSDYISFNIIDTKHNNQIAFMVEIRRMEDLK